VTAEAQAASRMFSPTVIRLRSKNMVLCVVEHKNSQLEKPKQEQRNRRRNGNRSITREKKRPRIEQKSKAA
jgi:hypothetical protein